MIHYLFNKRKTDYTKWHKMFEAGNVYWFGFEAPDIYAFVIYDAGRSCNLGLYKLSLELELFGTFHGKSI